MRKGVMAIAAALALGTATIATGVTAAPHGGGGGGGGGGAHFSGGGGGGGASFGGNAHMGGAPMAAGPRSGGSFNGGASFNGGPRFSSGRLNSGTRFSGGNVAFNGGHFHHRHFHRGFGLFAFGGGPVWWDSCWRLRRVWTPWGWHWRRINVCW